MNDEDKNHFLKEEITESSNTTPMNSVIDHYQKILGFPNKSVDLKTMPKALRLFAYFVYGVVIIGVITIIILIVIKR
jgi:hypothetical protein